MMHLLDHFKKHRMPHPNCIVYKDGHIEELLEYSFSVVASNGKRLDNQILGVTDYVATANQCISLGAKFENIVPTTNPINTSEGQIVQFCNTNQIPGSPTPTNPAPTPSPTQNPTTLMGRQVTNPITWSLENTTGDITKTAFESIAFALGITQWGLRLNVKFLRVKAGTGANVPIKFLSKSDPQFAQLFPDDNILAVTYYPMSVNGNLAGHMFFNDNEIWSLDGKPMKCSDALAKGLATGCTDPNELLQTYKITTVGRHEFGHAIGMQHFPATKTDTMYTYYDANTNSLGPDEVQVAQSVYGIRSGVNPEEVKNVNILVTDNATFQ